MIRIAAYVHGMHRARGQEGMTLVELVISMSISALIISVIASAISISFWLPRNRADEMASQQDALNAQYWITRDAGVAQSFTPGTAPDYGSLVWVDYTTPVALSFQVDYSYDAANGYLMRTEQQNGLLASSLAVAKNIVQPSDVAFSWSPTTSSIAVSITSTVTTALPTEGITTTTVSAIVNAAMRPHPETVVFPPGSAAVPTPVPGSQTLYVSGDPQLLTGSLVAGGGSALQSADGLYYATSSTGNNPSQVVYTATSQIITLPSMSTIQVIMVGQTDNSNASVDLYVQDSSAGFPAVSQGGHKHKKAGQSQTLSFFLSSATVSYIAAQQTRVVNLKVAVTARNALTYYTDQIMFIVSP